VCDVRKQVGRVVVAALAAGAVATGCAGPSQVGSAVIIGDRSVSLESVQSQLATALGKPDQVAQLKQQGGSEADVARGIVTQQVLHDLLGRQAAAQGIAVTDQQVDQELATNGGADQVLDSSLYDLATLRDRVRDNLIAAELARKVVGGLSVKVDLVAATSEADADAKAATLAAGGPAADALFADANTSARGQDIQAVNYPDDAGTVLFGTPVGQVVVFQPSAQQAGWIVFRVVDRRTDVASPPDAVNNLSQQQLVSIGERQLQPVADQVGVTVNPRYGVWDPIQLRVVGADQKTGEILSPPAG
jgi:hypothetical protein